MSARHELSLIEIYDSFRADFAFFTFDLMENVQVMWFKVRSLNRSDGDVLAKGSRQFALNRIINIKLTEKL